MNEGVGFFPGQASLAYFFFLGSSGSSNSGMLTELLLGAVGSTTGAAISISGAGLGRGIPIFVDKDEAKSPPPTEEIYNDRELKLYTFINCFSFQMLTRMNINFIADREL